MKQSATSFTSHRITPGTPSTRMSVEYPRQTGAHSGCKMSSLLLRPLPTWQILSRSTCKSRSELINAQFPAISEESTTVDLIIRGFRKVHDFQPLWLLWLITPPNTMKQVRTDNQKRWWRQSKTFLTETLIVFLSLTSTQYYRWIRTTPPRRQATPHNLILPLVNSADFSLYLVIYVFSFTYDWRVSQIVIMARTASIQITPPVCMPPEDLSHDRTFATRSTDSNLVVVT